MRLEVSGPAPKSPAGRMNKTEIDGEWWRDEDTITQNIEKSVARTNSV